MNKASTNILEKRGTIVIMMIIYAHCMLWYINRNVQYHESNVGYALAYTMHVKVHSTLLYQSTYMLC